MFKMFTTIAATALIAAALAAPVHAALTENGLNSGNGLESANGLDSANGLNTSNGTDRGAHHGHVIAIEIPKE